MTNALWDRLIAALPENLKVSQVAAILKRSPNLTRRHLLRHGYQFKRVSRRVYVPPAWTLKANWKLPNIDIARKFDISRERVRAFREKLHKPKVESRGRKAKNG